jgi:hypothetical protein
MSAGIFNFGNASNAGEISSQFIDENVAIRKSELPVIDVGMQFSSGYINISQFWILSIVLSLSSPETYPVGANRKIYSLSPDHRPQTDHRQARRLVPGIQPQVRNVHKAG